MKKNKAETTYLLSLNKCGTDKRMNIKSIERIESSETNQHTYGQLIFDKDIMALQCKKTI